MLVFDRSKLKVNPNVAHLCREKTRQGAPDVASHSLGKVEAYLTVRELLAGVSTGADGVLWREFSDFGRFKFATLGLRKAV
jgi:hypothetical protein